MCLASKTQSSFQKKSKNKMKNLCELLVSNWCESFCKQSTRDLQKIILRYLIPKYFWILLDETTNFEHTSLITSSKMLTYEKTIRKGSLKYRFNLLLNHSYPLMK